MKAYLVAHEHLTICTPLSRGLTNNVEASERSIGEAAALGLLIRMNQTKRVNANQVHSSHLEMFCFANKALIVVIRLLPRRFAAGTSSISRNKRALDPIQPLPLLYGIY